MIVQTTATAYAWYSILHFAYPERTKWQDILAGYAVSVALNAILPANLGTLVFLIMVTGSSRSASRPSSAPTPSRRSSSPLAGAFTYLYLFVSVGGSFDISFSWVHERLARHDLVFGGGTLHDRAARAPLLAARGRLVGQGEGGWRDPREPQRLLRARVPALVRQLGRRRSPWSASS